MPKYHGQVGYAEPTETEKGIFKDVIVEYPYFGDVLKNSRKLQEGGTAPVNGDITVGNSISIVADAYARDHFWNIRYISWQGVLWTVTDVQAEHPRLILRLGKVYNGPKPSRTEEAASEGTPNASGVDSGS